MQRRTFLALSATGFASACSMYPGATPLDMAKNYAAVLADAISAAADAFLASTPPPPKQQADLVQSIVDKIQAAKDQLTAAVDPANAKVAAKEVVAGVRFLSGMVSSYLGSAAAYVPVALDVLSAFINALPPPANAPATPPAELQRAAAMRPARTRKHL